MFAVLNIETGDFYSESPALKSEMKRAGIPWINGSNLPCALPVDFVPLRTDPRLCMAQVREKPAFIIERGFYQLAAIAA